MDSLHFELEATPVYALALSELLECYRKDRNNDPYKNPLGKQDENHLRWGFALLAKCFPLKDSTFFDAEAFEAFKVFLIQQKTKKGELYSRGYANKLLKYVRSVFYWAAKQKVPLITEARAFAISQVKLLQPSPRIRETKKRKSAPDTHINSLIEHCERQVIADMVQIEFFTGARPGETCGLKDCWIDKEFDGVNWLYLPDERKTAGRGKSRPIVFTKTAQEILEKYITDDPNRHLFLNSKGRPFTTRTFGQAIKKTIAKHGIPKLTNYQVRRNVATWGDGAVGLDKTRAGLGHANEEMTRQYLDEERDIAKAKEFALMRERALAATVPAIAVGDGRPQTAEGGKERPVLRVFRGEEGGAV